MKKESFEEFLSKLNNYVAKDNSLLPKPEKEAMREAFVLIVYLDKQLQLYVKKYQESEKAKVDALIKCDELETLIDAHSTYCPLQISID